MAYPVTRHLLSRTIYVPQSVRMWLLVLACSIWGITVIFCGIAIFGPDHNFAIITLQKAGLVQAEDTKQRVTTTNLEKQAPASTATTPAASATNTTDTTPRYATSPDPRSTSYSATPPQPAPSDINITITHPHQVSAGTKIVSNALKEYTVYYGGDIVFSTPTVVFHKSISSFSPTLTAGTPDGLPMVDPFNPWYDTNPNAWVSNAGSPGATMSSWPITLQLNSNLPVGTYQAHVMAWRAGGTGTLEWEYDGFITLDAEN